MSQVVAQWKYIGTGTASEQPWVWAPVLQEEKSDRHHNHWSGLAIYRDPELTEKCLCAIPGCLRREDSSCAGSIAAGSLDIMTSMAAAVWPACCLSLLLILLLQPPTPGGIRHQLFQLPRWAEDPQLSWNLPGFRYQMGTAKATHFLEWQLIRVSSSTLLQPWALFFGTVSMECLWSEPALRSEPFW